MDLVAIAGLAALVFVKEVGVPVPVPGDVLVIAAGAALADDLPAAGFVLAVVLVAGFIGASVQFFLLGSALRRPLLAALDRLGIGEARLAALSDRFRRAGSASVAVARMTPGVRAAAIPAAAIARIPYAVLLPGVVAGNTVFVTAHFALGVLLGTYALDLMVRAGGTVVIVAVVLVVLAVGGWVIVRHRRGAPGPTDAFECWADCSCPACVAIVARTSAGQVARG